MAPFPHLLSIRPAAVRVDLRMSRPFRALCGKDGFLRSNATIPLLLPLGVRASAMKDGYWDFQATPIPDQPLGYF
jgi:hypothetical protein